MATKATTEKKSVYLIWGSDEYEVSQKAKALVESLCPPDQQAFGLETVDGNTPTIDLAVAAINKVIASIRTVGFFGADKTIWLRDVSFLAPKAAGGGDDAGDDEAAADDEAGGGDVKERLAILTDEIKKGLPDGQRLVISAAKVNKSYGIYKAIEKTGEIIVFNPPEKGYQAEQATEDYVEKALREAGLEARGEVIKEFLDRTGRDTRQIRNEIQKLVLYVGDRKEVRIEDVRAIVSSSREAAAWDLADAVAKRDMPGALATLRHLVSQKEAPQFLIATLEGRIRDLIVFRQCIDKRWLTVKRGRDRVFTDWTVNAEGEAWLSAFPKDPRKMHWFRVGLIAEQATKYSFDELLRAHRLTTEAHERMVSTPVPADITLEHLLISIMRGGGRASG